MKKILVYTKKAIPFIVALLIAKSISVLVLLFLPPASVEKKISTLASLDFKNYRVEEIFGFKPKAQMISEQTKTTATNDLKDFVLQAIYKTNDNSGFIILLDLSNKEAVVLSLNDLYKGYTLTQIFKKHVILTKQAINYVLKLDDKDIEYTTKPLNPNHPKELVGVSKKDLLEYANNVEAIWKHIALKEVKKNNNIEGFEVEYIRHQSPFGKLGLKKGDIILKVNGELLNSYSQAFKIYGDINSYDYLEITVLRNGKEKDLAYEIQ